MGHHNYFIMVLQVKKTEGRRGYFAIILKQGLGSSTLSNYISSHCAIVLYLLYVSLNLPEDFIVLGRHKPTNQPNEQTKETKKMLS